MGYVTLPRPFQGHFVIRRLGLAMFNPHKFEMSTITYNQEMKGNAKCKNSRFEPPPLGDLGVTHRVHIWLAGKRVVDFLSVLIFSR